MRIENDVKLDFSDVLIRPNRSSLSSRKDVNLKRSFTFINCGKKTWQGIPIVASNMDTTGTFAMANALSKHGMMVALHKHYRSDELVSKLSEWDDKKPEILNNIFISTGTSKEDFGRILPATEYVNKIMIDVANGYSEDFIDCIKRIRYTCPEHVIAAGNVVTPNMAEAIILAGADIVKIGIGNGSACTTRLQTGVGYPQFSAIAECADAVHGLRGHVMADGGCNIPADFAKAFGGGADFIMSGSYFAGHAESGGNIVDKFSSHTNEIETYLEYYGMSSNTAQEKYGGEVKDYRSSEGRTTLIPYKGDVVYSCKNLLGGLRSACTYIGASEIKDIPKRTTFIRVNNTHNQIFESNTIRL